MMRTLYVILIAILLSASLSLAQDSSGVSRVGSLYHNWQWPYQVIVQGDYAYLSDFGCALSVINISNPANPQVVGYSERLAAYELAVNGNFAYVSSFDGFHIVDIHTPQNPISVGYFTTNSFISKIAARDTFVYLVDSSGLHVVNVSNPDTPQEVGLCSIPNESDNLAVAGNYAFTTSYVSGRLDVVDVRNPTNPHVIGVCNSLPRAKGIAISGNYLYVANDNALQIINIANPATPQVTCMYQAPGGIYQMVKVNGNYAYLFGGLYGYVEIVDVTNPLQPVLVTRHFAVNNQISDIALTANNAYLTYYSGFAVTSITNPTQPTLVSNQVSGSIEDVAVSGNRAYLANNQRGLRIVDVSDRSQPQEIGSFQTVGWVYTVVVSGNTVFLSDMYQMIRSIDVTNPANPLQIDSVSINGLIRRMILFGSYAYVVDFHDSIWVVDVSQPTNLRFVRQIQIPSSYDAEVAFSNNNMYIATNDSGVCIYDVTSPATIRKIGECNTERRNLGVAASGNYLFVSDDQSSLRVFNVSNPSLPQEVFNLGVVNWNSTLLVSGSYLFAMGMQINIYNISDPLHPYEVGHYNNISFTIRKAAVSSNHVFAVERPNFSIFDCSEALPVIERASGIVPHEFALHANYPNPFNAVTTISYDLPETTPVKLSIYDITGKEIKTLLNFHQNAGRYTVQWDAKEYSSGTYLCRLQAGEHSQTQKLLLLK